MRLHKTIWLITLPMVLLWNCGPDAPPPPEDPEEVLKTYQGHVDKNQWEAAKQLSTDKGRQWLEELSAIIASEQPDSTLFHTEFLSVNCSGEGDTLLCQCVLQDQYERYTSDYHLIRTQGQWLVDAPQEEIEVDRDIMENVPDSLIQDMLIE